MPLGSHYFLLEAFDNLGRHLFGTSWTGNEYKQKPTVPPDELEAGRVRLAKRIEKAEKELEALSVQSKKTVNQDRLNGIAKKRESVRAIRNKSEHELADLPRPNSAYREAYEAHQRNEHVFGVLFEVLQSGSLKAEFGSGLHVPVHLWQGENGFKPYLHTSSASVPRSISSTRHDALLIPVKLFDKWLKGVRPLHLDPLEHDREEKCEELLRMEVSKGPKQKTKRAYFEELSESIPDLSWRAFDRTWRKVTTPEWRSPGPTKGTQYRTTRFD